MAGMLQVPKRFFVTSGKAVSKVSDLNAFDEALVRAGIGEQNLVYVSSVLPVGVKKGPKQKLPMGAITHCVLAQQRGSEGETISAGIAYGFREDEQGGYVVEGHGHMERAALKEILQWKIDGVAKLRGVSLKKVTFVIEELVIPMDHYGTSLAALVFYE